MPEDDTTIEHILAKSDGGTDHPSNLVLTHADCNARASNMPVIRKVQLRERLRQSKSAMGEAAHQTHREDYARMLDSVGVSELAAGMRNRAA
jgi:5-methylcytosine-specific restriction endonuclease McrA